MPGSSEFPPDKCRSCVGFQQLACIAARAAIGPAADALFDPGAETVHILDPTARDARDHNVQRFRMLGCVHVAIIQHDREPAARSEELD